jgi:hypothetical protein
LEVGGSNLIFPSELGWQNWGLENPLHRLFVLLWEEMFNEDSLDSWQVRTCNSLTLLEEMAESADNAETFEAARFAIQVLIAELKKISRGDIIISRHYPGVNEVIGSLPNGEIKSDTIPFIQTQIRVLQAKLKGYRKHLVMDLRELLLSEKPSAKEDLITLTAALATELMAENYSLRYLSGAGHALTDPSENDFGKRFDNMVSQFSGEPKGFICKMGVALPSHVDAASLQGVGVCIFVGVPKRDLTPLEQKFFKTASPQDIFADVSVEAMDPYDAERIAEEKFSNVFAVRQLYQVTKTLSKKGSLTLVTDSGTGVSWGIRSDHSRMGSTHRQEPEIALFFKMQSQLDPDDLNRLNAAAQYHRLACMAATDEARLVNLWIAFESLTRREHSSIIESICSAVAPCMAGLKIQRLIRALGLYVQPLYGTVKPEDIQAAFPNFANGGSLSDGDVLDSLLECDKGPKSTLLYRLAADHPLLTHRIFQLRRGVFAAARDLHRFLEKHRENVDWQLRRIYRSRNNIAHQGRGVPTGRFLLQHLHTYFISTVHCWISDLQAHAGWRIIDAMTYRRMAFEQLVRALERDATCPVSREQLCDPTTIFGSDHNATPAWAAKKLPS